jgi:hypothetical protein
MPVQLHIQVSSESRQLPAQPPVRTQARSHEGSRPCGPSDRGDGSPGAYRVVSEGVANY